MKMKNKKYNYSVITLLTAIILVWSISCKRDFDELDLAKFPNTPEVFIDGFSQGLNYAAFGGSKVTAFDVDQDVKFSGSASMKIEVPDAGDPEGAYAGGVYFTTEGRDLSEYDALTFWAKASKSATIDLIGFGNDLGESKYLVSQQSVAVNSNWKKYIIPIPDASRLTEERGMFYFSEGPEEGLGYTFWIDEVKFEKLGTIAHKQAKIQDGMDVVESTFNGLKIPIGGLSVSFNMPTGIDKTFLVAPAYFTFSSSNAGVATVDASGMVSVLSAGTAVITAKSGDEDAAGSLTIESAGDFNGAPDPTQDQEDVISIFSNAYTNVPVEFYNGYWEPYQTTLSADFTVGDDDILYYTNFNFVGIQFSSPSIDATSMTHLHMDVYIPNAVDPADKLQVTVKDMGADGTLDDGNDPSITYVLPTPMASQSWISVDIDLSGLPSKSKLAQLVLENLGTGLSGFYLDNIYLYGDGGGTPTGPTEAAPTPPARDAADVISIYGDEYTNLSGTDYPDWGQATVVSDVDIAGNTTLKFTGLNFQGLQFAVAQDISGMEFLHLDFWTANSSALNTFLISTGPVETAYALAVPTSGWTSLDIPISSFSGVDLADIIQMKFDGNGDIYLDNIYFYTSGGGTGGEPTEAAPTPTEDPANVLSIYSDAYTGIPFDNFDAGWCGGASVEGVTIEGNNTLKKITGIDCQGIDFSSNRLDLSEFTHIHFDLYTNDADLTGDVFNVKLVDFAGGGGEASALEVNINTGTTPAIVSGSWVSVDVDITSLGGVVAGSLTRSDIAQIGITTANLTNVWYDNIYFYKDAGSTATEPAEAAPTPDEDAADVISLFSDAYTDVTVDTWRTDWSAGTLEDVSVEGNAAKKYSALDFVGILTEANQVDASGMTHLHIDIWSADITQFSIKLVDFGADGAYAGGDDVEHQINYPSPAQGQWVSYDIPLTDFTGLTTTEHIAQYILVGQPTGATTIWMDNMYFYNDAGGAPATEPTTAAPTPDEDPGDVISLFSDAYTDVTVDTWRTDWSAGTLEDVSVAGNAAKKYSALDFVGILTEANQVDASGMTHLHIDIWSADITQFSIKLVDFGADGAYAGGDDVEHQINYPSPAQGQWVSYDIPLTDFTGLTTTEHIAQYILVGQPTGATTIWMDNMYFYNDGGGSGDTGPTVAAPTPTADAANVVSIYSDAYTDIAFDNFDAGWCGGSAVTGVMIAGNNTLKKNAGIDCHGIDFSSNKQDLSTYTHIHFDFYTDDTDLTGDVFNVKLVDFGGGAAEASALEVNINTGTTPGIVAGTWVSVDIDITSLGGIVTNNLTRSDIAQIGITTANLTNVWYDNIYLYK